MKTHNLIAGIALAVGCSTAFAADKAEDPSILAPEGVSGNIYLVVLVDLLYGAELQIWRFLPDGTLIAAGYEGSWGGNG